MKHAECIIFPDIHGRDFWKNVLLEECGWDTDTFIFLGDYLDPYPSEGITVSAALINCHELMTAVTNWRRSHWNAEFIFLMGNHDAHYTDRTFNALSGGCRKSSELEIPHLLESMGLQIAYEQSIGGRRVLFTHAGVMKEWYEAHRNLIGDLTADNLNSLVYKDGGWRALAECDFYRGGYNEYGSPLWADMRQWEEHASPLKDFGYDYQVVGHTQIVGDDPIILDGIADLDCRHPFALTSELRFEKIDKGIKQAEADL